MDMFDETQLLNYETYADYLDSMVQPQDLFYLRDPHFARMVVQLGYRFVYESLFITELPRVCETIIPFLDTEKENRYVTVFENLCRSSKDVLTPKQFQSKKDALQEAASTIQRSHILFSTNCRTKDVFLLELAARERPNRLGMITVSNVK